MNYDNLINLIVEEIYKKMDDMNSSKADKPKAVLLWGNNDQLDLLQKEFNIVEYDKSVKESDVLIISKLCMRGLANLATANSTSDEERFILQMIMGGKQVFILDNGIEYKKYKQTAPKSLYNKYISYENEICTYGVRIVKDLEEITSSNKKEKIIPVEYKNQQNNTESKIKDESEDKLSLDLRNKKLISEIDLRRPVLSGLKNIVVSKKCIITPLALDFIRIHGLKLKKM